MDYNQARPSDITIGQWAALYAAKRSMLKRFQTGASIVKNDRVIEIGWSHVGERRHKETPWSTHAEAHALRRAGFQTEGAELYIATYSSKGNLTFSNPCSVCQELLSALGFKAIYFTTPTGWDKIDPRDL